jgi:hypothetical protein
MKQILKSFIPLFLLNSYRRFRNNRDYNQWIKSGCQEVSPPHLVKQKTITEYQQNYGYTTLIETGTYLGDMVEAQRKRFKKVISIELSEELWKKAQKRFKRNKNVEIVLGDSGKVLPEILKNIHEPVIFWLDGHYSEGITAKGDKDCPIFEELNAIFGGKTTNPILLIDDARCFTGEGDYPTIDLLTNYIQRHNERYQVEVKHDMIRYVVEA